ncbi:MAG: ABC transporter substrate-binding protein [Candidatus Izemoplasmataceae bacterium]
MKKFNAILKKLFILTIVGLGIFSLAACNQEEEIIFGTGDWESNEFHDEVAKYIIEEGYGINARSISADTSILITSLKSKDIDVAMEIWSDNITSYQDDLDNNEYVRLSTNFDDNAQGLYIPKYLQEEYPDLKSIQDLPDYAHLFPHPEGGDKGIIYGGPQGWSATLFLEDKMEAYGLDEHFEFRSIDSNAILSATIADAFNNEEPWVGYNWEPTWVMGIYDLVLLEDTPYSESDFQEGKGAFPSVNVDVVVTNDFETRYPEIATFLSNYETTSDLTSEALGYMQNNEATAKETAIWFLKNNEELWSTWVTSEAKENILNALENE